MQDELTPEQLAELKTKLLVLKQDLQNDLADSSHSTDTVELDQQSVGRLSRMDAMQMQQMALETQRRNQQQLIEVERALIQMEKGDYGYCSQCGDLINPKRLAFNPTARMCIECAS
ncbi:MAG: TraR/DksA family transcriptional regulator [Thiomicrospira sp.]|uniref:TraR/DksA family transcriptional regulator n=1 Tax=Thiomicrospira sp. TaxID=935 RepID=UPI0019F0092C|nr:TraR/DksA family transcriptional regulator [Thiomicrospira sp.]MBE0493730.1 TraR/DksA family transcriptional regulator [Thiomicrospira sp.]